MIIILLYFHSHSYEQILIQKSFVQRLESYGMASILCNHDAWINHSFSNVSANGTMNNLVHRITSKNGKRYNKQLLALKWKPCQMSKHNGYEKI